MCIYRRYIILSYVRMLKMSIGIAENQVKMGEFSFWINCFLFFNLNSEIWKHMESGAHGLGYY